MKIIDLWSPFIEKMGELMSKNEELQENERTWSWYDLYFIYIKYFEKNENTQHSSSLVPT